MRARLPQIDERLGRELVRFVHSVRELPLAKPPGVAETLDCGAALGALAKTHLDAEAAEQTLSCLSKSKEDIAKIKTRGIEKLLPSSS